MKAPFLIVVIALLHIAIIGGVLFIQGCGTVQQTTPEPPPAPVMPPSEGEDVPSQDRKDPTFTPPTPEVEAGPKASEIKTYTVKKGDVLSRIASKFDVSVRELSELNGLDDPNTIRVGQELVLPAYAKDITEKTASGQSESSPAGTQDAAESAAVEPGEIYKVASGDTLSEIAAMHGTTVSKIMKLNNLDSSKIIVGQKLRMPAGAEMEAETGDEEVPAPEAPEAAEEPAPQSEPKTGVETQEVPEEVESVEVEAEEDVTAVAEEETQSEEESGVASLFSNQEPYKYTVAEGETLRQIAMDYVVDVERLRELNNLGTDEEVKPGQQILIPLSDL